MLNGTLARGATSMPTPPTPAYQPISALLASGDFSNKALLGCVNSVPYVPKHLEQIGLYDYQSESARAVMLELLGDQINLIPVSEANEPGLVVGANKRTSISVTAPRLAATFTVLPSEVAAVREVGGVNLETVETRADQKLKRVIRYQNATMERHRLSAACGRLLDSDGSTLINYFTLLGISEDTLSLDVGTSTTDMIGKATTIRNMQEDALGDLDDDQMPIVELGRTIWQSFVTHPNVKDAYKYFESQRDSNVMNPLREDLRYRNFVHGDVIWRQYRGSSVQSGRFIADTEGRVIMPGVEGTYIGAFCPPDDMKTYVNTPGLPFYMTVKELDHDGGWEVRVQSNPIHILSRPKVAIKITSS